jgi:hypothetical protein
VYVRSLIAAIFLIGASTGCIVGENSGLGGPGDDDGDGEGPKDDGPDETINRPIPSNGLQLDAALARRLPTGPLGSKAADGTVTLGGAVSSIFGATDGQHLMKYVAICALPQDGAIKIGNTVYEGYYGLAPEWADGSCGESCQRLVSACLLAHANAQGMPVQIGLVGNRPAALAPADQLTPFTFQEAAFYGNLMRGEMHACVGADSLDATNFDPQRFIDGRVCGVGGCGILSTGICGSPPVVGGPGACDLAPTGVRSAFGNCHVGPATETTPRTSATYAEVITVYLKPTP